MLDSIGELRAAYPLAEAVFVGGSLIPHGGQSIFEPAAIGKPIIIGSYTTNFEAAVTEFLEKDALIQLEPVTEKSAVSTLATAFGDLLKDDKKRKELSLNALEVMEHNRGAAARTIDYVAPLLNARKPR